MDIKFVIFLTDIFIFLLVIVSIGFAIYSMRYEHLRSPWRRLRQNRIAMISAFILGIYLIIGLSDSIHFQKASVDTNNKRVIDKKGTPLYNPEVLSVLDFIVLKMKNNTENTYSAPFATHSFSKETIIDKKGKKIRIYKRLQYGGLHLRDTNNKLTDISIKLLGSAGIFIIFLIGFIIFNKLTNKKNRLPGLPALAVMGIIFILSTGFYFSSYYHIFGTDKVGQDVFYRSLKGIRTGMVIGTLTTLIMLPFGVIMGVTAGYFKGIADDIIQYIYITLSSIPGVLLIASAILLLQVYMDTHPDYFENISIRSDTRLFFLCGILGISSWTGLCRILRGETLKLREMEYVQASLSLGVSHKMILTRHIIPNIMHIILITVVLDFSGLVLAEAVLSYIGVGVDPSMESWGNMINAARLELARDPIVWWNLVSAFILMFGLVLSANLFADGVRDAFDPKIRTT